MNSNLAKRMEHECLLEEKRKFRNMIKNEMKRISMTMELHPELSCKNATLEYTI